MWGEEGEGQVRNGKGLGTTGGDGHVCAKRRGRKGGRGKKNPLAYSTR